MLAYGWISGGDKTRIALADGTTIAGRYSEGTAVIRNVFTATEAAEWVDAGRGTYCTTADATKVLDLTIREATVKELTDPTTGTAAAKIVMGAWADAYKTGINLDPDPAPLVFEMLIHDEAAAGLQLLDADVPALVDDSEYTTPDGQPYFPPTIGGQPAVALLRAMRDTGMHVSLAGEPGSGKTTLAQVAFGDQLIRQQFTGETTVEDVVGRWLPVPGKPGAFTFTPGPLATAMREGRPYLANELVRAPLETQAVFLSVMDHQRRLLVESNPEQPEIIAADGFMVIVDYNPGSGFGLSEALHSRITCPIEVPSDLGVATRRGVPTALVAAAQALHRENLVAVSEAGYTAALWVPSIRDLLKAKELADRFGIMFAANALVSFCPDPDRRPAIADALTNVLPDQVAAGGLTAH